MGSLLYEQSKNGSLEFETIYFVTDNEKDFSDPSNPSKIHENLKLYANVDKNFIRKNEQLKEQFGKLNIYGKLSKEEI